MPEVAVFMLSVEENSLGLLPGTSIDEDLLAACVRAGGARGVVRTSLGNSGLVDLEAQRAAFRNVLATTADRIRKERMAAELASSNQVVSFSTAPKLSSDGTRLQIRCRNFRLVRAVRSEDANAMVSDAERPPTGFEDVIGAKERQGISRLHSGLVEGP